MNEKSYCRAIENLADLVHEETGVCPTEIHVSRDVMAALKEELAPILRFENADCLVGDSLFGMELKMEPMYPPNTIAAIYPHGHLESLVEA